MARKLIAVGSSYRLEVHRRMEYLGTEEDSEQALSDIEKLLGQEGYTTSGNREPASPFEDLLVKSFRFRTYDVGSDLLVNTVSYGPKDRVFEEQNVFEITTKLFESPTSIALLRLIRTYYIRRASEGFEAGEIKLEQPWSVEKIKRKRKK